MNRRQVIALALITLLIPGLLLSTAVVLRLGWSKYEPPGAPLVSRFYAPWDAFVWAFDWGFQPEFRGMFVQGIALAFVPIAFAGALLGLRAATHGKLNAHGSGGQLHSGDQYLGTPTMLRARGDVRTSGDGIVLGKDGADILRVSDDAHVLVLGPSRSGKTVGTIVPTLLEQRGSMFVHDPKHELAEITGRWRSELGNCYSIDPTNWHADGFNPLLEICTDEHLIGDCQIVLSAVGERWRCQQLWQVGSRKILGRDGRPADHLLADLHAAVAATGFGDAVRLRDGGDAEALSDRFGIRFCGELTRRHGSRHIGRYGACDPPGARAAHVGRNQRVDDGEARVADRSVNPRDNQPK